MLNYATHCLSFFKTIYPTITKLSRSGRYYEGDIEGKLAFGVQSSDDPSNFGCGIVTYFVDSEQVGWRNLTTGEYLDFGEEKLIVTENQLISHLKYDFSDTDLSILEQSVLSLKEEIGEEYFEEFDVDLDGYTYGDAIEEALLESGKFALACRYGIGSQIILCLKESESKHCQFTCQL